MPFIFLDTSALVKRYISETGTAWVRNLTTPGLGNICAIVNITEVEILSALYRRVRGGSLSLIEAQKVEAQFRNELQTNFRRTVLTATLVNQAMDLVVKYPLRSNDAIQLATACYLQTQRAAVRLSPPTFVSADHNLNQAALAEGLVVDDPNLHP